METEFVQIGEDGFNVASIHRVTYSCREQCVRIEYGVSNKAAFLRGPAALAFKEWWKCAKVHYLDIERLGTNDDTHV